jgi:phosphoribosylformimino-5-aminoimidazole carboxamide ribotide isomerase
MLIIPAIDIYNQKVVRLKKGSFEDVTYYDFTPLQISSEFEKHGFKWVHIVDLEASKSGSVTVENIIKEIKNNTSLNIEFGGGIRSKENVQQLIDLGVNRVIIGSLSVDQKNEFEKIISLHDPSKIIVAADAENEIIKTSGWTKESGISIYDHINYCVDKGINTFLCTDIKKDGMLAGPSFELYDKLVERFPPINLIASGGISSLEDIKELKSRSIYATVVGKAIYEKRITLEDLASIGN